MKKDALQIKGRYIFLILIAAVHMNAQQAGEDNYRALGDRALNYIEQDSFTKVALLLDKNLEKAKMRNLPLLKARILNIQSILYLKLEDFDKAETLWWESIRISDSLGNDIQHNIALGNLLHAYVLFGKYDQYDQHIASLHARLGIEDKTLLFVYENEVMKGYNQKDFRYLLDKAKEALATVESGRFDSFFNQSERNKMLKERFSVTFKMYVAYALSELGSSSKERLSLLQELYHKDLEAILWYSVRIFKNKARIRNYLMEYYRDVSPNKDSVNHYLGELERANKEVIRYLNDKSVKKATFLSTLLEKNRELRGSRTQLTLEANLIKQRTLAAALVVFILLGVLWFLMYNMQESRFRAMISDKLAARNRELKDAINRRQALEGMLEHVQDTITMDMYSSFRKRLASIGSAVSILKEIKQEKQVDNIMFNTFFDHLEQGVEQVGIDIKDLIWANNSQHNFLSSVVQKLKDFAKEIEQANGTRAVFIKEDFDNDYRLKRFWNRQILLIFKEAINNAFKYTEADVTLTLRVEDHVLIISCVDGGQGFDMDTLTRRSGLANMVQRAHSINCDLVVTSEKGKGTMVVFKGYLEGSFLEQ